MKMANRNMPRYGDRVLKAMSDHNERSVASIAETIGATITETRNSIDWLVTHGFVSKRKDAGINLNLYTNREHKSECQKAMLRRWK